MALIAVNPSFQTPESLVSRSVYNAISAPLSAIAGVGKVMNKNRRVSIKKDPEKNLILDKDFIEFPFVL